MYFGDDQVRNNTCKEEDTSEKYRRKRWKFHSKRPTNSLCMYMYLKKEIYIYMKVIHGKLRMVHTMVSCNRRTSIICIWL